MGNIESSTWCDFDPLFKCFNSEVFMNFRNLREGTMEFQRLMEEFGQSRQSKFLESDLFKGVSNSDRNYFFDTLDFTAGYPGFLSSILRSENPPNNSMEKIVTNFQKESNVVSIHMAKSFAYSILM